VENGYHVAKEFSQGLGTGAQYLADIIKEMSNGRLTIKGLWCRVKLCLPLRALTRFNQAQPRWDMDQPIIGKGKNPAFQFFSTVPFGMNANEMNAWLYQGDGMKSVETCL
jgi:TRAP-type mannitol/chloroaromatic compound transport system substrate-binding protein